MVNQNLEVKEKQKEKQKKIKSYNMDGGVVYGEGMKGKVMDYGTITDDLDSLEHIQLHNVKEVKIYILEQDEIIEYNKGPELLDELIHLDTSQNYVVKEFTIPNMAIRTFGHSKKTYMMREINGFRYILPVVKKHKVVGMPYKKDILIGFEIIMKNKGLVYDGTTSRCFIVNRKCSQTMSESIVNQFTEKQFVQFVEDILKTLIDIQKLDVAHGDIKLDNIMKCGSKFELIDWENNRLLEYSFVKKHKYLGLSPLYFKINYGVAWYPAFKVALIKYFQETGGYDNYTHSQYATMMIEEYTKWFDKYSDEEIVEQIKYSLDLCAFGMILYGIMRRNPNIKKSHHTFIMNLYRMKDAATALKLFRNHKTRKI
jgi:serine/threonine protein kinase